LKVSAQGHAYLLQPHSQLARKGRLLQFFTCRNITATHSARANAARYQGVIVASLPFSQ